MPTDSQDGNESNIESAVKAVTELVKAVPVYDDAIQPVAKEAGKALQTVGQAVNAALMPIRGLIWGFEKIEEFVRTRVAKKLEKVPPENICTPDPAVAGPALESLRYTGHKESLRELYANLLASAMDINTAKNAHPGFVEIIRNLSADEAKIMSFILRIGAYPIIDIKTTRLEQDGERVIHQLVSDIRDDAGCEHHELTGSYWNNLERLGLVAIRRDKWLVAPGAYDHLLNDAWVKAVMVKLNNDDPSQPAGVNKYCAMATIFGRQFGDACVVNRDA